MRTLKTDSYFFVALYFCIAAKRKCKIETEREYPIVRKHCAAGKAAADPERSGMGMAPLRRAFVAVNVAFGRLAFATRPFYSVTPPLSKNHCFVHLFREPCFTCFSALFLLSFSLLVLLLTV